MSQAPVTGQVDDRAGGAATPAVVAPAAIAAPPASVAPMAAEAGNAGAGEATPPRLVLAVLNCRSGACLGGKLAGELEEVFRSAGVRAQIEACEPEVLVETLENACKQAAATPGAVVVVGGGDGTIKTAAELALKHAVPLGILPMGTMNLLPKDLGLPLDVVQAAGVIASGVERRVDVARVNGKMFLHSSVLGVVPLLGVEREEFRRSRTWRERAAALWRAGRLALTTPQVTLRIEKGGIRGKGQRVRTYSLAVSNNLLSDKPGEAFKRASLDGGRLGVYISRHRGRLGLFALLFTLGTGRWTLDQQMEVEETTRVRITARRRRLPVSNDGEVEKMRLPLEYTLRKGSLRVIVPAPQPEPAAGASGAEAGVGTGADSGAAA